MTAKRKREFVLPAHPRGAGRPPLEYVLMGSAEVVAERLAGSPEDLFSPTQFAAQIDATTQWPRAAVMEGRGPEPTWCGGKLLFRRGDILAWLRFLAKEHRARTRKAA